jgi:hypothetical protein
LFIPPELPPVKLAPPDELVAPLAPTDEFELVQLGSRQDKAIIALTQQVCNLDCLDMFS